MSVLTTKTVSGTADTEIIAADTTNKRARLLYLILANETAAAAAAVASIKDGSTERMRIAIPGNDSVILTYESVFKACHPPNMFTSGNAVNIAGGAAGASIKVTGVWTRDATA